jgi:cell division septum initiation protein DivIVA
MSDKKYHQALTANRKLLEENARLKAEVERLRKAGDAMMGWIDRQHDDSGYPHSEAWEAAKEGKPHA